MALDQGGDGGDQLRQGRPQGHEGQGDDGLRHAQSLGDEGAVVHQQVGAHGNEGRTHHQQEDILAHGGSAVNGLVRTAGPDGIPEALSHGKDHVQNEHGQQDDARQAGEGAAGVGDGGVEHGGDEKEDHRGPQTFAVRLRGADGDGQSRDQGGVADDGADGVAVGDLSVTADGGGGGYHHLRQGGADGHHRGADEDLRHMETVGQARGAVHEPVAALDEQHQTHDEQKNGYEHDKFLLSLESC